MLNHDQVFRLRKQILETGQFPESLDGYHLGHATFPLPPPPTTAPQLDIVGHLHQPEHVFGQPFNPACLNGIADTDVHAPSTRMRQVEGGRIVGATVVLGPDSVHAPLDVAELDPVARAQVEHEHKGCVVIGGKASLSVSFAARTAPRHFPLRAFFLPNLEPGNYGSFIFRQFPQLLHAAANPFEFDCYVVPDRVSWFFDAIDLLGLPEKPVFCVREVSGDIFDTVFIVEYFDNEGFLPAATRRQIEALVERVAGAPEPPGAEPRIYVSRTLSSIHRPWYRVLRNELEVEAHFQARGYTVLYPETMRFDAQIRAFAAAGRIAGLSGSGMLNAVFSRPATRLLDIESVTNTVRQHAKLYASSGLRYSFHFVKNIIGTDRNPIFRDFTLPPTELAAALDWLEA